MDFTLAITDGARLTALGRATAAFNAANGTALSDNDYLALVTNQHLDALVAAHTVTQLTKYEFLSRFTQAERVAIRAAAAGSGALYDFMQMLEVSGVVKLDNSDTIAGVNFLETAGLIGAGRAAQILAV